MDAQLKLWLLLVLHLEFSELIADRLRDYLFAGTQTHGKVAHFRRRLNIIRDLADDGGPGRFQLGFDSKIHRALARAIQSLPAHLPRGAQAYGRGQQEAIENHLDWQA